MIWLCSVIFTCPWRFRSLSCSFKSLSCSWFRWARPQCFCSLSFSLANYFCLRQSTTLLMSFPIVCPLFAALSGGRKREFFKIRFWPLLKQFLINKYRVSQLIGLCWNPRIWAKNPHVYPFPLRWLITSQIRRFKMIKQQILRNFHEIYWPWPCFQNSQAKWPPCPKIQLFLVVGWPGDASALNQSCKDTSDPK